MDDNPAAPPLLDGLDLAVVQAELQRGTGRCPAPILGSPALARHTIAASLEQVKQHIEVGQGTPELGRFRRSLLRPLAQLLAATLLYCLRFLTNRLRRLHHAQLNALQHLQGGMVELEQRMRQDQQRQSAEWQALLEQKTAALESKYRQEIQRLRTQVEELRRASPTPCRRAA